MISVYCDGANEGKTGTPGGWGFVILKDGNFVCSGHGGDPSTTNNRQELTAAIEGLSALISKSLKTENEIVELVSDSKYTLNLAIGAYKAKLNKDLVEKLQTLANVLKIKTRWVPGHSGEQWNEECDRLAGLGREEAGGVKVEPYKHNFSEQLDKNKTFTTSQVAFLLETTNSKVWELSKKCGYVPISTGVNKKGFKYSLWAEKQVEEMTKILKDANVTNNQNKI